MSTFQYSGFSSDGREARGVLEAETLRAAREELRHRGILPTTITEQDTKAPAGILGLGRKAVSVASLALFTRRLSTLTAAAVPIHEALEALHRQEKTGELRSILSRLRSRLAEGSPLARAMASEPKVFGESYIAMVAAGEAGGALDKVLQRLADFLERQEEMRRSVSTALAYPGLMAVVGSGVMLFLLTFVVPKITGIFADTKATLPFLTVALLAVSNLVRSGWWLLLLLTVAALLTYRRLSLKESFLQRRDRFLVSLPLVGGLLQTLALARFSRVLGLLLGSGVPLLHSLEITSEAVVNRAYRAVLHEAGRSLAEGGSLSATLERSELFPPVLTHLIAVGERSGALVDSLETAGSSFEREFEAATGRFMALLEPLLVLAMGLMVGLVVIAVLLPIFQLNELVK